MSFWNTLRETKKPFFCVAPMADVTDAAFRQLLVGYGTPDVVWTEFVSANGLMSPGREALLVDLSFSERERPIVAQLFSSNPETMYGAAKLCAERGFDGIDINMGCPDRTIEKQGAGAAMIRTPAIAASVIEAAKRGIADAGKTIPLSVKTRVGYNSVQIDEWIPFLLQQNIAALTVHARTRKELSKTPAQWSYIKQVVALRDRIAPQTVIIGNGDVTSLSDGQYKARETGCDGVMVGRALFGNPWFFDATRNTVASLPRKQPWWIRNTVLGRFFVTKRTAPQSLVQPISVPERLRVLVEHTILFETLLGKVKSFAVMKKHFKAYCTGFAGAKELRMELMETKSGDEVKKVVDRFLSKQKY